MRQLVAVAKDGQVHYFLHDGDVATQIAQITGEIPLATIVEIGVSLGDLHPSPNGHKPARKQAALPAAPRQTPGRKPGQRAYPYSLAQIIEYVDAHPEGVKYEDLWQALLPTFDKRKVIAAMAVRVKAHLTACEAEGAQPELRVEKRPNKDHGPPNVYLVPVH